VKRGYLQILLAAVLFLLALGLTMYPVVSNWYIGRHQSRIQTEYREVLEQTDTAKLDSIREKAVAYNKTITPGAAEEAYSQESIRVASEDYVNQLSVSGIGIMGYVEIPKIGADLPIYHGTGADSLDRGTGHLLGSSLPVGGESTHTIITGHSGMASQKMFTDLEQLREGDIFYLHVLDETLAYLYGGHKRKYGSRCGGHGADQSAYRWQRYQLCPCRTSGMERRGIFSVHQPAGTGRYRHCYQSLGDAELQSIRSEGDIAQ